MTDALDHRGVVQAIRENNAVGQFAAESRKSRIVCYIARRKDERSLLGVELCNCVLQCYSVLVVSGDVSGTSGTSSVVVQGLVHRLEYVWVASHAEVVVGAPDSHLVLRGLLVGTRKFLGQSVDVVEVAIRLVLVLLVQLIVVKAFVVERRGSWGGRRCDIGGLNIGGLQSSVGKWWTCAMSAYALLFTPCQRCGCLGFIGIGVPCLPLRLSMSTAWASLDAVVCSLARFTRVW